MGIAEGGCGGQTWDEYGIETSDTMGTGNQPLYRTFGGTSSAAPTATGLAGLLLSHNPNLTNIQLRDLILSSAVHENVGMRPRSIDYLVALNNLYDWYGGCCDPEDDESDGLVGDLNEDGDVDILDVITLVNYIMNPDQFNEPTEMFDLNEDGHIDVLDVIVVVNMILQN